ncbi:MAG: HAD-IA family hydrolase, partial [Alphaproteobacteria bacterium]|nr:HAD-IA family hydrolase [Alphaproteobacteria bacterium]
CSKPYPHVVETLELLKSRGMAMGVLTNKIQDHANLVLSRLGLEQFFRTVLGAGVRPYSKPDPRLLLEVAAELGQTQAVMVGDSVTDVAIARAAGAPVILMSYGYSPRPAADLGADAVTDDFARLPELIDEICASAWLH